MVKVRSSKVVLPVSVAAAALVAVAAPGALGHATPAPRGASSELRGPLIVEYVASLKDVPSYSDAHVGDVSVTFRARHAIPGRSDEPQARISIPGLGRVGAFHADYSVASKHCYENGTFRRRWRHGAPARVSVTIAGLAGGRTIHQTVVPRPLHGTAAVRRLRCASKHL